MKLFTKTFGCQMNFADSDEMARHFRDRGVTGTEAQDDADIVLVNTCTVRDLAEHKAASYIGRLEEWKAARPERLIVVTGCAAERAKDDFRRRFPFVDLVVGAKDIERFPTDLASVLEGRALSPDEEALAPVNLFGTPSNVVQYVTIMRGCNYSCTYCIVPSVRGRETYRSVGEILDDVRARVAAGAREIWLLGQTVNSYRPTTPPRPGYDFSDLLRDVAQVAGVERLRFISPHPFYLTDKLIAAMTETPSTGRYIHLPVQSGSDDVLKRMRRTYTRELYLRGVAKLRAAMPDISISTDIIVGFPGETEQDFAATMSLVEEAGFSSAYCFKYSPRPGTEAAKFADDVTEQVKDERLNRLLAVVEAQGAAKAAALIGTEQDVLFEEEKEDGTLRGKTASAWRVRIKKQDGHIGVGRSLRVRITGAHSRELHGEPPPIAAEVS